MEPSALREKLHSLIDSSPEDKLEEVYHIFQEEEYSDDLKSDLDDEFSSWQEDGESISRPDIDKMVEQLLHGKK